MRLELGAGEKPHGDYDIHVDILPLPGINAICRLDRLPFRDSSITAVRANHVLEHQSYELIETTLHEWARVLAPGGNVDIGVPDARFIAQQWVQGKIDTGEANYWLLGGHSDRPAHKGVDERGVPRWIWNAHHTLFDSGWLRELLEDCGFTGIKITCYDVRNLRCLCVLGTAGAQRSSSRVER
ncbi:MAG: methyltransferase domain-containing protein [Actinobacteria bacterium]|nr:methyltransferase domain-containing protein [Actinomycetota bacterium]